MSDSERELKTAEDETPEEAEERAKAWAARIGQHLDSRWIADSGIEEMARCHSLPQ